MSATEEKNLSRGIPVSLHQKAAANKSSLQKHTPSDGFMARLPMRELRRHEQQETKKGASR